jgi:hypothetical protein
LWSQRQKKEKRLRAKAKELGLSLSEYLRSVAIPKGATAMGQKGYIYKSRNHKRWRPLPRQGFAVTRCYFTAPTATSAALSNSQEVLLHPYSTQIFSD